MMGDTSFSIVVPCYNYSHYLACVDSILSRGVKVQVIVIKLDTKTQSRT
jgi:GT2 family glycosyltransferase